MDLQSYLQGNESYRYRIVNIDLTSGLSSQEFSFPGAYIVYYDGIPDIEIQLNDLSQDIIILHQKGEVKAPFSKFYLSSPAQAGQIITLFISSSTDIKLSGQEVVVSTVQEILNVDSVEKVTAMSTGNVGMSDVATSIMSLNAGRKSITLKNTGVANTIFIGNSNAVTSADGFPISPSESLTIKHYTGGIWGVCSAGLAGSIAFLKEG
ncbi:MAG: hypothetical protein JRN22_02230 [Nitrososphaerota archaeon]|nr:hypothetical protein [Nitrososphaerota archaeon]